MPAQSLGNCPKIGKKKERKKKKGTMTYIIHTYILYKNNTVINSIVGGRFKLWTSSLKISRGVSS